MVKFAFADPPYPGQSEKHYGSHHDFAGEVDHRALIDRLSSEFDGYVLNTGSVNLWEVVPMFSDEQRDGVRIMAWPKTFAAFKRNVPVAYAWEPVFVKAVRKAEVRPEQKQAGLVMRDWMACPITMKRGISGAKPERLCWWLFEVAGLLPGDEFHDLFLGSGAVTEAHRSWVAWRTGAPTPGGLFDVVTDV